MTSMWEFISAISERRPAVPSFYDGLNAQLVADAVLESHAERRWVETPLAENDARSQLNRNYGGAVHRLETPDTSE